MYFYVFWFKKQRENVEDPSEILYTYTCSYFAGYQYDFNIIWAEDTTYQTVYIEGKNK